MINSNFFKIQTEQDFFGKYSVLPILEYNLTKKKLENQCNKIILHLSSKKYN